MRRLFRSLVIFAVLTALTVTGIQAAPARTPADPAYFEFTDVTGSTFVFQLHDQVRIDEARRILAGEAGHRIVFGRITPHRAAYNPGWHYHYDPASIQFPDRAIEVCDATIPQIEEHLDEVGGALLPGHYWCPWTSRLTREL